METTIQLAQVISLVIGVILPILVGLVTTRMTKGSTKAILLALLAAASGFLTEMLDALQAGSSFAWDQALLAWLSTFVIAVATHFGLWKPTGTSDRAQAFGTGGRKPPIGPSGQGG